MNSCSHQFLVQTVVSDLESIDVPRLAKRLASILSAKTNASAGNTLGASHIDSLGREKT